MSIKQNPLSRQQFYFRRKYLHIGYAYCLPFSEWLMKLLNVNKICNKLFCCQANRDVNHQPKDNRVTDPKRRCIAAVHRCNTICRHQQGSYENSYVVSHVTRGYFMARKNYFKLETYQLQIFPFSSLLTSRFSVSARFFWVSWNE